jgi:3-dehydroquinate synthase
METFIIQTPHSTSKILLGEQLTRLSAYLPDTKTVIITDGHVHSLYKDHFPQTTEVIVIGHGEKIKTLDTLNDIFTKFVEMELDRSSFVVGIGGGIVCDITGFAASVYLRGVDFGFVSSTLLSQVDASIGGKNGVNFMGYKNMIGVFSQPKWVICDLDMLKTLPEKEFIAAFAEIIKHGCIRDASMFEYLEQNATNALQRDTNVLHKLISNSLAIKSDVVQKDEKESGLRRILNFGHTIGHAIEKNNPSVIHGNAISIGMVVAAKISEKAGLLSTRESERIENLIAAYKLPTEINIPKEQLFESIGKDKKRENDTINFVLLDGIGSSIIKSIEISQLKEIIYDLC